MENIEFKVNFRFFYTDPIDRYSAYSTIGWLVEYKNTVYVARPKSLYGPSNFLEPYLTDFYTKLSESFSSFIEELSTDIDPKGVIPKNTFASIYFCENETIDSFMEKHKDWFHYFDGLSSLDEHFKQNHKEFLRKDF